MTPLLAALVWVLALALLTALLWWLYRQPPEVTLTRELPRAGFSGGEVPAGATSPIMVATLKPLMPSSSQVAICGVDGERCSFLRDAAAAGGHRSMSELIADTEPAPEAALIAAGVSDWQITPTPDVGASVSLDTGAQL